MKTIVFVGIVYPPTVQDSDGVLGTRRGIAGCKRIVSMTTASKYFSFGICDSSTMLFNPTTSDSSVCALFIASGLFISSAIAHSVVVAVVSDPPATVSCKFRTLNIG